MNDGNLLKSSIQLPKDTALAPVALKGRNKAITLLYRTMHYTVHTHTMIHMNCTCLDTETHVLYPVLGLVT